MGLKWCFPKLNWSLYHVTQITTRIPPYFGGRCEGWQSESSMYYVTVYTTVLDLWHKSILVSFFIVELAVL